MILICIKKARENPREWSYTQGVNKSVDKSKTG